MVQFAHRMDLLKGSEIRELLKLTSQPDIISFAGGMPAPELFPVDQMIEASTAVLKENGRAALQYSSTEGFPRLREQIAERMLAKNNIHTDADHILVTSGSQEGLDFSARVFLNPGDVVLPEIQNLDVAAFYPAYSAKVKELTIANAEAMAADAKAAQSTAR